MSHFLLLCSNGFFTVHCNALLKYTAHHHPYQNPVMFPSLQLIEYGNKTLLSHVSDFTAFWHSPPPHNCIINQHKNTTWCCHLWKWSKFYPCQFSAPQPIFTLWLIDKENARRGQMIHRGQVIGLFLCWRYKVGDLMRRGSLVGEMLPLCCLVFANVAVAQCGAPLISQTYMSPIEASD